MVPWKRLVDVIVPCYPFLQQCYAYSIPGMEETRYKIPILRQFVGIDIGRGPDSGQKARFYRFRRLPEQNGWVERGIQDAVARRRYPGQKTG